jgi:hypothetical protein
VRAAGYDVTDNAEKLVKWYETLIREAKSVNSSAAHRETVIFRRD